MDIKLYIYIDKYIGMGINIHNHRHRREHIYRYVTSLCNGLTTVSKKTEFGNCLLDFII